LEFLSGWTGRLAPGDVAFVCKYPPGFLSKNPLGAGTNGTATMSRVIGLDGVNRLLHGEGNPDGWVAGGNVLVVDKGTSPLQVLNVNPQKDDKGEDILGPFTGLSVLDTIRLDGLVKSNDEPFAFTSSGSRDAVVFNNIIQGPTICNNGFLKYDPRANPGYQIDQSSGTGGATPLRTVESHPRGSIEGGYHIGGPGGGGGVPGRVGAPWLAQHGQYDYVATFTGTFSTYPAQMFDRNVQPNNTLYLGLRAYKISDTVRAKVRKDADSALGSAGLGASGANSNKDAYMFQILPFSSRKAYLCQYVQDRLADLRNIEVEKHIGLRDEDSGNPLKELLSTPAAKLQLRAEREKGLKEIAANSDKTRSNKILAMLKKELVTINAMMASHKRGEKKSRFDDDVFDAVRTEDLANMVGAWKVGRVLDVKAMRHASYEGGPSDTGFALMVDVQTSWLNALPRSGGSVVTNGMPESPFHKWYTDEVSELDRQYVEYGTNTIGRDGQQTDQNVNSVRKNQLAVDVYNAQFPSMRASVGQVFAQGLYARRRKDTASTDANYPDSTRPPIPVSGKNWGLPPAWVGDHASWADYDALLSVTAEAPIETESEATDGAPSASLAPPLVPTSVTPVAPVAPAAAVPAATTTAATASAPITAAAVAAARPGAVARARKSPARARPATGASAASAAPVAPVAPAPTATSVTSAMLPEAPAPARRRERGAAQTSTVSAVFDSIFGGTADEEEPVGATPASPTPSSGSDASGTGPKTFRRPR
jgi:hypothetical protein